MLHADRASLPIRRQAGVDELLDSRASGEIGLVVLARPYAIDEPPMDVGRLGTAHRPPSERVDVPPTADLQFVVLSIMPAKAP